MKIKIDNCGSCHFCAKHINEFLPRYCIRKTPPIGSTSFNNEAIIRDINIVQEWCPSNGYYEVSRCAECPNVTGKYISFGNVDIICKLNRNKIENFNIIPKDCPIMEVV